LRGVIEVPHRVGPQQVAASSISASKGEAPSSFVGPSGSVTSTWTVRPVERAPRARSSVAGTNSKVSALTTS
jgi:hypothetical protein